VNEIIDYKHIIINNMFRLSSLKPQRFNSLFRNINMSNYKNYVVPKVGPGELNVNSRHEDHRARILSNLVNRPFEMNGQMFASVEAFFAGTLYPPEHPRHRRGFAVCYALSQKYVREGNRENVWWNGKIYKYGSQEHKDLCEQAILESMLQNLDRKEALLATKGLVLRHETGFEQPKDTFLTKHEFCDILTRIREKLDQ